MWVSKRHETNGVKLCASDAIMPLRKRNVSMQLDENEVVFQTDLDGAPVRVVN